jgi:hypothetical protein
MLLFPVLGSPVWSHDGQYIAYADNGVWLVGLGTRETRQLLADVPLEASASNAGEYRIYQPELFVAGADGKAEKLIVDVGVWEWNTVGVYDLASGKLQELEGQLHTSLLPLFDGRVLLYGNGGVAGEFALHMAERLGDINTYTEALSFSSLTDATLFTVPGRLSPDGRLVSVYLNALWTDAGSIYGSFELLDLDARETVAGEFPETVGVFRWQP